MTPDAFEQLVSLWLAEPTRADLRQQVEAAVAANPAYAALLAEWRRCDELLRQPANELDTVNWSAFKSRITGEIDAREQGVSGADDAQLDTLLRRMPSADDQVNWPRLRARIVARVLATEPHAAPRRWLYTRLAPAAALLAAAAALYFAFLTPSAGRLPAMGGVARVAINGQPALDPSVPRPSAIPAIGVAYVRLAVAEATIEAPPRYFVLDPVVKQAPTEESAGYY
jgi:hypothetical protein